MGRFRWPCGLRPLDYWEWVSNLAEDMDVLSLGCCVSCVGSGLCDGLITRSELYPVCMSICVWRPQQRGGLGLIWAVANRKKYYIQWVAGV